MAEHTSHSKVELQSKLDNPWVVAGRDDASKVTRIEDLPRCGVDTAARGNEGIQVANRIGEVRVIEQIEELSAKFEIARFGQREKLTECKIHIHLPRPAQTVPSDISDVCAPCTGSRRATRTGNRLAALHHWPGKDRCVEERACGHVLICVAATHSGHQAGTSKRACPARQSIE